MENQHRKIIGYRELNEEEISLMNQIKTHGADLQRLFDALQDHVHRRDLAANAYAKLNQVPCDDECAESQRWMAIGKTNLQQGIMALTRAVARPTFF